MGVRLLFHLTDGNVISTTQKLEIHDVFQRVSGITVSEPRKIVAKSYINNVIFAERSKILFSLNVKTLDFIEEVRFQQRANIGLHRMCARRALSCRLSDLRSL